MEEDLVERALRIIKQARKAKKLSLADMAEKMGISPPAYNMIEEGRTELKVRTMIQLFDILNIKLDEKKSSEEIIGFSTYDLDSFATKDDIKKLEQENKKILQQNEEIKELLKEMLRLKNEGEKE